MEHVLRKQTNIAEPRPSQHLPTQSKWQDKALKYGLLALSVTVAGVAIYYAYQAKSSFPLDKNRVDTSLHLDRVTRFPRDFSRMGSPGMMSNIDGSRYCKIEAIYPNPSDCDQLSLQLHKVAKEQLDPRLYAEVMKDAPNRVEMGFMVYLPEGPWRGLQYTTFGENPRRFTNFRNSLKFVEKAVLENPKGFFDQSSNDIKKVIINSHRQIIDGFEAGGRALTGFRDYQTLVTPIRQEDGISGLIQVAIDRGGEKANPKLFHAIARKFHSAVSMDSLIQGFNFKEKRFVETYFGMITPKPAKIPGLFSEVADQVKKWGRQVIDGTADPVKAASVVHQKIGQVHAFKDGNGRLSRLWMNIMLMLGGEQPVAFQNDDTYTEAVVKAANGQLGAFESLLRKTIQWNRHHGH